MAHKFHSKIRGLNTFISCVLVSSCSASSIKTTQPIPTSSTPSPLPSTQPTVGAKINSSDKELVGLTTVTCPTIEMTSNDSSSRYQWNRSSSINTPPKSEVNNLCYVADSNILSSEDEILKKVTEDRPRQKWAQWNKHSIPQYMNLVTQRFHLTPEERALLTQNGFVVSAQHQFPTYSLAYHELFQSQIPLYVSIDSILHAIFASNDQLIANLETSHLKPLIQSVLDRMHCTLPQVARTYPREVARDIDIYLGVARSLLTNKVVTSHFGAEEEISSLFNEAKKSAVLNTVSLFGRPRVIDFSAYTPRGHYQASYSLSSYFQAMMWLSRIEFNMVSRSCRSSQPGKILDASETPREAMVAIALSDLAERANAMPAIDMLDRAWGLLAGPREDISLKELIALREQSGISNFELEGASRIRQTIGNRFQRATRMHPMPQGAAILPAIATFLGPRTTPDAQLTRKVVADDVQDRSTLSASDIAYALGHDRAKTYLASDLKTFPTLAKGLDEARAVANQPLPKDDLYSAWFGAIRALSYKTEEALPSFIRTIAFEDFRMNSALTAFGQLRHNYVLLAGQGYGVAGCAIPDGYVEPAVEVFDALIEYAHRGEHVMSELDPKDISKSKSYFTRLSKVLEVLRTIAIDERAGRTLTQEQIRFLSMVAEKSTMRIGSGSGPSYTGWYFDLFRIRETEGVSNADFIADYFTSPEKGVSYIGASKPYLGFFVVDTNGKPRLMVGPVAHAYETTTLLSETRLTDSSARNVDANKKYSPWTKSYTSQPTTFEPSLLLKDMNAHSLRSWEPHQRPPITILAQSTQNLGLVTLELLDHHRQKVIASQTQHISANETAFQFPPKTYPYGTQAEAIEAIRIRVGSFDRVYNLPIPASYNSLGTGRMRLELGEMRSASNKTKQQWE